MLASGDARVSSVEPRACCDNHYKSQLGGRQMRIYQPIYALSVETASSFGLRQGRTHLPIALTGFSVWDSAGAYEQTVLAVSPTHQHQ